jgi:subtilisin family serine protease
VSPDPDAPLRDKADPWVLRTIGAAGTTEFFVVLSRQADVSGAERLPDRSQRRRFVFESLRAMAGETQAPILATLSSQGVENRPFWIANMILVRGGLSAARNLAARDDVARLTANPVIRFSEPIDNFGPGKSPNGVRAPGAIEWNVSQIHAPDLWSIGIRGQGVVVAGADTGYAWAHPALKGAYRGWNGSSADHNYNWHDAVHSGGGSCGFDSAFPCDDFGHGTHTMGTMVGDDGGANQIGVAPGAKWIGCRNMDQGNGTPARYAECFQFFLAPTNLAGGSPDPSKAPDVINNSWGCPPSEGCTDPDVLKTVLENVRAAGIVVVASAGNAGPACSTVLDPPAIYAAAVSVGATDSTDTVASFSSRGPVTADGSGRMKPDVAAPGVSVRSSVPPNGYSVFSGTSMAGPHAAGTAALLQSAFPELNGDPTRIETLIERAAMARTSAQTCGGVSGSVVPNNTYGWGRLDALAAYDAALGPDLAVSATSIPSVPAPGLAMHYDVLVESVSFGTASTGVSLTAGLPVDLAVSSVSATQGSCVIGASPPSVTCVLGAIAAGGAVTVTINGTPATVGPLQLSMQVSGVETELDTSNNVASLTTNVEFGDVPPSHPFHDFIARLARARVTAGCGGGLFCPVSPVTRAQIAVFLLRANDGASYLPPPATGTVFTDVPASSFAAAWIEQLAARGIAAGCGGGAYCPSDSVTRAQAAVFLLRTKLGIGYTPPAAVGLFSDLPASSGFARWAEDLYNRGITAGCGTNPLRYCPADPITRGQMAVFVATTFALP